MGQERGKVWRNAVFAGSVMAYASLTRMPHRQETALRFMACRVDAPAYAAYFSRLYIKSATYAGRVMRHF